MYLQFVKIEKRNNVETKKVIFQWSDVDKSDVEVICQNFMDGFLYAMGNYTKIDLRRPMSMIMDGYNAVTWRWHDSDSGTMWEFEDENGNGLYRWDKRRYEAE